MLTYLLEDGSRSGTVDESLDRVLLLSQNGLSQNATFVRLYGTSLIESNTLLVNLARPYAGTTPGRQQPGNTASAYVQFSNQEDGAEKDAAGLQEAPAGGQGRLLIASLAVVAAVAVVSLMAWGVARYASHLRQRGTGQGEASDMVDARSVSSTVAGKGQAAVEACTLNSVDGTHVQRPSDPAELPAISDIKVKLHGDGHVWHGIVGT